MKPEPKTIISLKVDFENLFYAVLDVEIRELDQAGAVRLEDPVIVIGKSLRLILARFVMFDAVLCVAGVKALSVVRLPDVYIAVGAERR